MIPLEDMPEDNEDLAKRPVTFPVLEPNTAQSCPVPMKEILSYLRMESPDGASIKVAQLKFLRTALVGSHRYWIWSFQESDGADCFVTVSLPPDEGACIGYEENFYALTPEQFMLGDFHQVF